jgi:hypothetical protein
MTHRTIVVGGLVPLNGVAHDAEHYNEQAGEGEASAT